ncbi:AraC family transcriptional regulator [Streptomyces sp. NPDC004237]|uniref:helix-turn-helix domain-containing protein n=1 Tax=Streptomyces sp. NPDC004237 TaxID=3154455 RepID=UPI0033AF7AF8
MSEVVVTTREGTETRHPTNGPIPGFGFNPPAAPVSGFEITDLSTLHARMADGGLERVHRVDFHTITLITQGNGEHAVDFVTHPCRPGTLLWIRPGQVQRFSHPGAVNGPHVMFAPSFPAHLPGTDRLLHEWYGPACRQLGADRDHAALSALLDQLRAEYTRPQGSVSQEILQLLLGALLLNIDRLPQSGETTDQHAGGEVYARFRSDLERSYATSRRADDYARRLGYTVKTLTRACLAATGRPVKQVIDARVALEAQRLLAHTDTPVSVIARRLGFSEPSNFGKFFARHTGTVPGDFRRAHQGTR